MADFDDYIKAIKKDASTILGATLRQGKREAKEILLAHIANSEERLERWTEALANGFLTPREFKILVNNQVTLGRMRLRTIEVIGKRAALDFRDKLRTMFVERAFAMFL